MKPTVKNIAKLAGVSTTSVSLVLNDKPIRISPEKRESIISIAEELGYEKEKTIIEKKKINSEKIIGVIKPNNANLFWNKCMQGIENHAAIKGYKVIVCNANNSSDKLLESLDLFDKLKVAGIVVMATTDINENDNNIKVDNFFKKSKIPFVIVDRAINRVFCDFFTVDDKLGAYMATEHLLITGHRKIGIVSGPTNVYSCRKRIEGYKEALAFYGLPIANELMFHGGFTIQDGYNAMEELIKQDVDAVFACNDVLALGIYKYGKEHNIEIGKDLSVIGFDDSMFCEFLEPPLTSVHQPVEVIGDKACELLIFRITNEINDNIRDMFYAPDLVERASVNNKKQI